MGASGIFISLMVTVYHHVKVNVFAKWRRHIGRNCFFYVAVKLRLIIRWKGSLVNVRVSQVKDKSGVML